PVASMAAIDNPLLKGPTGHRAHMTYYFSKTLDAGFDDGGERTNKALNQEGFGIITEIDVKETLRKKLGIEFRNYTILGACNPRWRMRRSRSRTRWEPCSPAMSWCRRRNLARWRWRRSIPWRRWRRSTILC